MKPQDLYRGQAPAAMGMMGQGLMEAGANTARMSFAGYQALGQGLASGVEQATNAYQEKKKLDAQNKADEGFYNSMLPYFDESTRNDLAARHEDLISDPSASALDKAAFYHSAKSYLSQGLQAKESAAKVKQYEAEAAYKNAVANLKVTPTMDHSSLIPPSLGGGTGTTGAGTPGASTMDGTSNQGFISPFEDLIPSEKPAVPWLDAKSKLSIEDAKNIEKKIGGQKWWNALPPQRQHSILNEGLTLKK